MKHARSIYLILLVAILFTACTPATQTATAPVPPAIPPTLTAAPPTLTSSPTATATPAPTATITPTATPAGFRSNSVLTDAQKEKLYKLSLTFIADTEEKATAVAKGLKYLKNDGHPSLMCGPLAAAILRDAGIINPYTDIHAFWLLRPTYNTQTIKETFPEDKFDAFSFKTRIDEFDFNAFPLQEGDFVYLYAGPGGSFEHMLVVTRVDEEGRAYTVTNLNTKDGYIIQELMLYDPTQPKVGQFYEWTNRQKNSKIGTTGFGGFDVWRPKVPITEPTTQQLELASKIDKTIADAGGEWRIFIKEIGGPVVYERNAAKPGHFASIIKVPVALLFFKSLEKLNIPPDQYASYIAVNGDGRTYEQFLRAMLVYSEEEATKSLIDIIKRNGLNIPKTLQGWGVSHVMLDDREMTAEETATLLEGLYQGTLLAPEANQVILELMAEHTAGDDTRLGVLGTLLPEGSHIYNKRGTITDERLIVGDAAIIDTPGKDYVAVVVAYPESRETLYEKLDPAIADIARDFWEYLSTP